MCVDTISANVEAEATKLIASSGRHEQISKTLKKWVENVAQIKDSGLSPIHPPPSQTGQGGACI